MSEKNVSVRSPKKSGSGTSSRKKSVRIPEYKNWDLLVTQVGGVESNEAKCASDSLGNYDWCDEAWEDLDVWVDDRSYGNKATYSVVTSLRDLDSIIPREYSQNYTTMVGSDKLSNLTKHFLPLFLDGKDIFVLSSIALKATHGLLLGLITLVDPEVRDCDYLSKETTPASTPSSKASSKSRELAVSPIGMPKLSSQTSHNTQTGLQGKEYQDELGFELEHGDSSQIFTPKSTNYGNQSQADSNPIHTAVYDLLDTTKETESHSGSGSGSGSRGGSSEQSRVSSMSKSLYTPSNETNSTETTPEACEGEHDEYKDRVNDSDRGAGRGNDGSQEVERIKLKINQDQSVHNNTKILYQDLDNEIECNIDKSKQLQSESKSKSESESELQSQSEPTASRYLGPRLGDMDYIPPEKVVGSNAMRYIIQCTLTKLLLLLLSLLLLSLLNLQH